MLWRGLRTSFDVVHCHDLDTLPIGWILGRLKRKVIVYDAHESFPDMLDGSVHRVVRCGLTRLENFFIRRVDLLITVGERLRRHFVERGARRSVVVGNWKRLAEFSRTQLQNQKVRRQLGIPDSALVVVCLTQLLKDRKLEELLTALEECPNAYAIVGGRGVLEELVVRTATTNPRILFVGFASGEQIADYTCAADVVYYGFDPDNPNARFSAPNKLYEALAAGRPLITGDFGEIAEVVREAKCGIILPLYSAEEIRKAIAILEQRSLRTEMAAKAARFGATFLNWEKGQEILYREYSSLLPGALRAPSGESQVPLLAGRGGD
jgi:glycosyltransferase involved in cell wall biosynthesis